MQAFRPGASAETVRSALAGEGLRAHSDVVAWWGWHDGVTLPDAPPIESGPGIYLRSENTLVEDWHVHLPKPEGQLFRSLDDFVGTIIKAFDEGLVGSHPEDPRVPIFDAPTGDLRRLSYW